MRILFFTFIFIYSVNYFACSASNNHSYLAPKSIHQEDPLEHGWPAKDYFKFLKTFSNNTFYDYSDIPENVRWLELLRMWIATNEDWYHEEIMEIVKKQSGVYMGTCCGGQNLSRLCHGNYDYAIMIDINPFVTEIFMPIRSFLISKAKSRAEYLALFKGVHLTDDEKASLQNASFHEIYRVISKKEVVSIEKREALLEELLKQFPEELKPIVTEFWQFFNKNAQRFLAKTYRSMRIGNSWLHSEANFAKIKRMTQEGRIVGIRGNWGDKSLLDHLSAAFKKYGLKVALVYISNIIEYARSSSMNLQLGASIGLLPFTENSILVGDRKGVNYFRYLRDMKVKDDTALAIAA